VVLIVYSNKRLASIRADVLEKTITNSTTPLCAFLIKIIS
jgi:hypothetical protein